MKKLLVSVPVSLMIITIAQNKAQAQQYTLKQSTSIAGMKTASTIYVKGMRKRTEGGAIMGFGGNIVTIEQCDSQRTIKINDAKKLYFIEPFASNNDEVIDEDAPKTKTTPVKKPVKDTTTRKGGIITQWYSIIDTGERKKMYGFTARHIWTSNKMKGSPDACYMKDSMQVKTDGWYIDLPQFNCPVHYRSTRPPQPNETEKPECTDRYVTHKSGKGKLGFPLTETTTIIIGGNNEVSTSIETVELSTAKLDSMLFEIPPGYTEVKTEAELQDKIRMKDIVKNVKKEMNENTGPGIFATEEKKAGMIRIGVYVPTGDEQVQAGLLQKRMVGTLTGGKVEAISITTEEDARKYHCDYTLNSEFTKIKSASKVGGLLKVIKNGDLSGSYNIQAGLTLKLLSDGSVKTQPKVDGKYEGKIDEAAGSALDDGCREVLKALK